MSFVTQKCLCCQNNFQAPIREVNRGNGKFCNRKCSGKYNGEHRLKPVPNVTCAYCHVKFYKNASKQTGSKSQLFFCCRAHKDIAQQIGGIQAIMPSHFGEVGTDYRTIAFRVKEQKCERCAYDSNPAAIIVHHIDRDRKNNVISNLEVLCANCHAIEHLGEELSQINIS